MEKSASQLQEPTPPAAEQFPPLPTATDQRPAELPSPVSPAVQPQLPPAKAHEPPSTVATEPSSRGRKRALEANLQIENSNYYKMRLILKDLRPHILEVLRTPDFRNCIAATEIQERMKLMLQLYQEMIGGGESSKGEKIAKSESFSNTVVGGSAFGWNFITHGGTEPVYCGMTKEEYRISHPIIQVGAKVELHNTV